MDKATQFLQTAHLYQLGDLDTERPHPKTAELSDWAKADLPQAIKVLAKVDADALRQLHSKVDQILKLRADIQDTFAAGRKVYFIGCGATGRLSMLLESLYREKHNNSDNVIAFMAGGDVALVHSLEGFEDFPNYAVRHMQQLGFKDGDLLIAVTEGGETPYVIGGVEYAAQMSRLPYFLYCNPDGILIEKVERSKRVLTHPKVKKINLAVGPMGITGSTRMQASTVLQLVAGLALLTDWNAEQIRVQIETLAKIHETNAVHFLKGFIERESREYQAGRYILYRAFDYAISIFTDTTERAPTFSLTPFSHPKAERLLKLNPSLSYVQIPQAKSAAEAWQMLLKHKPRSLNWMDVDDRTRSEYLDAFDFGPGAMAFRKTLTNGVEHEVFEIERKADGVEWRLMDLEATFLFDDFWQGEGLMEHTALKMLMNIHSTLVMGRLGRYEGNLMTYVFPTNGKLVDRATRYVRILLSRKGVQIAYDDVVRELFRQHENLKSGESVVMNTVKALSSR